MAGGGWRFKKYKISGPEFVHADGLTDTQLSSGSPRQIDMERIMINHLYKCGTIDPITIISTKNVSGTLPLVIFLKDTPFNVIGT
jgi:hypothetical protein